MQALFLLTFFVIILAILLVLFCLLFFKRQDGEARVAKILRSIGGTVYTNYIIKDANGQTHEIDSILVNKRGVYVIEVKNYSGYIYGSDEQRQWTQVLAYGETKNQFYSPVKQNWTHCYHLAAILPSKVKIMPIVVFIKNNVMNITSRYTIGISSLRRSILNDPEVLTDLDVERITKILERHRDQETSRAEHIANVSKLRKTIAMGRCPRCGGRLVIRHGRYSDFYGCENYPRCQFIKRD